ncbi:FAD-binding domain containing protein [Grosmannia clavigera kw1407]|uniref:FAD-binding domain containing protein n=1 Tax=Grosmannia clavigera (strain kw1407 / UAMH 11150) TaxID=655863 RepID=F0XV37_GROCL|nr:FAD-binding domain containing protein [Grosmannia clavigera kw1407]EFW98945.1 FAD-binding domain containing protein [Grosmannia clavigera kw1407]
MSSPPSSPVLIIGAGIVGLTLAQALKKASIPFVVYERDAGPNTRSDGWGITVHWALPALEACLLPTLFSGLRDIQVDPQQGIHDTGRFVFLDLATAEPAYVIPPSRRLRLDRRKLRRLLLTDIDVQWGKALEDFSSADESVTAHFEDGTMATGSLLVGADGSNSRTRRRLFQSLGNAAAANLYQLPVRFMGVTVRLTTDQVRPLRAIDPLLFQGCHPDTGAYLWYSILSTPEVNGSAGSETGEFYEGQLNLSWMARGPDDEVPPTQPARLNKMRELAQPFEPRLRAAVENIPKDAEVLEVLLQDWPTQPWPNHGGTVTLASDAAHAMTMYRGEAFNHGITDAASLAEHLVTAWASQDLLRRLRATVDVYEKDLVQRTQSAVLLSRQACLDAHDFKTLTAESPLVSKRAIVKH